MGAPARRDVVRRHLNTRRWPSGPLVLGGRAELTGVPLRLSPRRAGDGEGTQDRGGAQGCLAAFEAARLVFGGPRPASGGGRRPRRRAAGPGLQAAGPPTVSDRGNPRQTIVSKHVPRRAGLQSGTPNPAEAPKLLPGNGTQKASSSPNTPGFRACGPCGASRNGRPRSLAERSESWPKKQTGQLLKGPQQLRRTLFLIVLAGLVFGGTASMARVLKKTAEHGASRRETGFAWA